MKSEDLYRNPFSDYNANVMTAETIVEYWCNPFSIVENFAGISESAIHKEKNPLIFIGGRGSGKTMFLRYWSYNVQKLLNSKRKNRKLNDYLNENGSIGIYLRIDGPVLRSFEGFDISDSKWSSIFTHYFELVICREYINVLNDLTSEIQYDNKEEEISNFLHQVSKIVGTQEIPNCLGEFLDIIDQRLLEVTDFRGEIAFVETDFRPTKAFASQSLSFKIPDLIIQNFSCIDNNLNFVILIDEFENFLVNQQRVINALLKFVKLNLTFRLGMRLEGFRTFETVSRDDFIKEGRDYQKIVFEEYLNPKNSGYQDYLIEIAKKRLEKVSAFKENYTNISEILGRKELLEEEAKSLVNDDQKKLLHHFKNLISLSEREKIVSKKNPLRTLLGILWYIRGKKLNFIIKGLKDYDEGIKSEEAKKFQYDYTNKYKLSLTILLCSIYRQPKSYYSFNTFSYLSSGIIGHFIELCRYSFRYAEFENKEELFKGKISREIQTKAARDYAIKELQQIKRIEDYGNDLYHLTENLGNIFRQYHKDEYIRYPETNQFAIDKSKLAGRCESAFNAAIKWSILLKKPNLQSSSPNQSRTEIFTLNRIFSPEFQISYRTRGGINESYNSDDIELLMTTSGVKPKKSLTIKTELISGEGQQKIKWDIEHE